jgi:DNA-binding NarL/FixJ family response regulator
MNDTVMNANTKFIIADNQDITKRGLYGYISDIFGESETIDVSNRHELVTALEDCKDGVVVLDNALFDINGIKEFLSIRNRFPDVRWLIFSHEVGEDIVNIASSEQNIGIILKDNSREEICLALMCMARGERYICHQITDMLICEAGKHKMDCTLTTTEISILKLIAQGKTVKEIAMERTSSIHTIVTHKKNIFRKLGINNVYEATKYALRAGLIEMVEYYI